MDWPIIECIKRYIGRKITRFDTPGHKAGNGLSNEIKEILLSGGEFDLTLPDEADAWSSGCVRQSEDAAASLWGARRTFFCLNGTTGALQLLLLATLSPGDKVVVAANCHRSVINGLILCGAQPVFVQPCFDERLCLDINVHVDDIEIALVEHKDVKAVVVTNPTYFGIGCDLRAIAQMVHAHGALLLVDEAHGAHWRFSDELPDAALQCGADAVVQSTHKMLNSLSQTSMLHIGSDNIDCERIFDARAALQSSSPNYLLLASLEAVCADMRHNGTAKIERTLELANRLQQALSDTDLICYNTDLVRRAGGYAYDATKLLVDWTYSVSGLCGQLNAVGVMPEMVDAQRALFHITVGDDDHSIARLESALREVSGARAASKQLAHCACMPAITAICAPRDAYYAAKCLVPLEAAAGKISAATYCFYPPGIAFLFPGALITLVTINYIRNMEAAGFRVEGQLGAMQRLKVLVDA